MTREPAAFRWLLSVDPGCGITAWALWQRRESAWGLERFNRISKPTVGKLVSLTSKLQGLGVEPASLHLVIEGQWFRLQGRNPGVGHAAVQALAEQRRTWQVVLEIAGASHEVVDPAWVSRVSKHAPLCADHARERDSVRRLISAGRLRWPGLRTAARLEGPGPDEWSAIMLGTYWLESHGQRTCVGGEQGVVENRLGDGGGAQVPSFSCAPPPVGGEEASRG